MTKLIERIGLPIFIQITIELWNEIFIVILISILLIEKRHDIQCDSAVKKEIPLTRELLVFYILLLIYNICDVMDLVLGGMPTLLSYIVIRVGVFGYYATGGVQTMFFLQVIKTHIARKLSLKKLEKIITLVQCVHIPLFILLVMTPFTRILYKINAENEYMRSWGYFIWQNVTFLTFLFIGIVIIMQWQKLDVFFKKVIAATVICTIIGLVVDFYIQLSMSNIMVTVAAIILFVIYEKNKTRIIIKNINELAKTKMMLAESCLSLEQVKNQTLMAQIQPHFINNSLMALRSRCAQYPDIYESITNFSLYLRSHFEALCDTKTISFEQEMINIEAYLALEQQNYKEHLKVEYEIEYDDFSIPALLVQPLVENAVRHGIGTYEKGGTVQINTYRKDRNIIIEVIDDGSGKNNITPQQKKRKGIGIENVQARVNSMVNGTLEIITRENGTTARIELIDIL